MINSPLLRAPEQTPTLANLGARVEESLSQYCPPPPAMNLGNDGISRLLPPWLTGVPQNGLGDGPFGAIANGLITASPIGLIQNIMQQLTSLLGMFGGSQGADNEQYFQNATAGSNGDPHLSFNGSHWDSMVSQPDLLHSDSIPGGYQVSTQVTPANANGVTYNQSATIALNDGMTSVSLDNAGNATLTQYGQQIPIQDGQTIDLGNGQTVARDQNGKLQVIANNGAGGEIATTLSENGAGVDVNVQANNVDLGGALAQSHGQPPVVVPLHPGPPHFRHMHEQRPQMSA